MPKTTKTNSTDSKFILLGEDDIDDQEILEEVFSSIDSDIKLQFINNGKKLVRHLQDEQENLPCLIVLDYNMPELNGAEILSELNLNERVDNVPKIIWSTSNAPAYRAKCMELGASDYLVKPSKIDTLHSMVKHMLSFCE